MHLSAAPASDYAPSDLVQLLNRGFEDYFVPIQFNLVSFLNMLRRDGIDLTTSRVLLTDGQPGGIALIARRGWVSRIAAMGIEKERRGKGAGSWFMHQLVEEAHLRDEREMVLEVIEQNQPAVALYRNSGFQIVRRLIALARQDGKEDASLALQEVDLREMGRLISIHGLPDLPWQLSGESIAQMNPPARAYHSEGAFLAISNPDADQVVIWSLLVLPEAQGHGRGAGILRNIIARYPGKTWHMPAILPEELGKVFESAGFQMEALSQWQMRREL